MSGDITIMLLKVIMKIDHLDKVATDIVQQIQRVSKKILMLYSEFSTPLTLKSDLSPLTEADLVSHDILNQYLKHCFDLPILSEEAKDDPIRLEHDWVWLIDPLDGTKEFLNKNGEFTVNVALVYKKRSVLGIIAVPVHDEIYVGIHRKGAYLLKDSKKTPLHCSSIDQLSNARLSVSRSHVYPALKRILKQHKINRLIQKGSALKYCTIAQGKTDASIRKTPLMEWDICAADCILCESGAILTNFMGEQLTFNNKNPLLNKGILASNPSLHSTLLELVQPFLN